jgi:hypothetical protein
VLLHDQLAGTTIWVDHAHITRSAEHTKFAIAVTASYSTLYLFCYQPMMPLKNWVMRNFNELGDHGCFGGERVIFGYAFDLFLMQWLKIYLLMPRGRA